MALKSKISDAEWRVMKIIWEKPSTTARQIIEAVIPETGWNPKTVKTLLNRLMTKKMIGFTNQGRNYHYFPIAAKSRCIEEELRALLDKAGYDSRKNIIIALIKKSSLSPEEIEDIRKELDSKISSEEIKNHTEIRDFDICL
jgi:BlaI family penicillinase repressor